MNKEYQYSERIDAYLRNELSTSERADFEHLVSQDPLLYNEFVLQQEIVSGLQEYRKQQLKSRLNQIDVTASSSPLNGSTAGMIAGGLVLLGLLGWWGYSHTTETASVATITEPAPVVEAAPAVTPAPVPTITPADSDALGNTKDKMAAAPARKRVATRTPVRTPAATVELTIPQSDSKKDLQEELPVRKADTETVQRKSVAYNAQASSSPRLNVIDNTNKSLQLHYCYQNGRIALMGFEKPYTFLDMPAENVTYLYYENNFYKLNTQQTSPAPIAQVLVTDQKLIDSLQTILKDRE